MPRNEQGSGWTWRNRINFRYRIYHFSLQMFSKTFLRPTFSCKWHCVFVTWLCHVQYSIKSKPQQQLSSHSCCALNLWLDSGLLLPYNRPLIDKSESSIQPSRVIINNIFWPTEIPRGIYLSNGFIFESNNDYWYSISNVRGFLFRLRAFGIK